MELFWFGHETTLYREGVLLLAVIATLYTAMMLVAVGNLLFMKRPKGQDHPCFEVLIPARNEAENIAKVVRPLVASGVKVTVFDDDSSDATAEIAKAHGALILNASVPLPAGWTGKNYGCHQLTLTSTTSWTVFLDADTIPGEAFADRLSAFLVQCDPEIKVVSGFAKMIPGRGFEPAYLTWVSWILLATNPFALVARTKKGHNRFTNGQFSAWRTDCLKEVKPFYQVRSQVLEDVLIGRLLARLRIRTEIIDMSEILSVRMYEDIREAMNGMSKNSCDIMGNPIASVLLSLFLLVIAWGWLFCGAHALVVLALLLAGKLASDRAVRTPIWVFIFAPITITTGALTIIWSTLLKRKGKVTWKDRTY